MSETQDDAVAELARHQAAQAFDLPDVPIFDDVGESPAFVAPRERTKRDEAADGPERERSRGPGRSIVTLEDLYGHYAEIGRGEWKLRVSRVEPKAFQGHPIAGFLCEVYEKISMEEFRRRFGGGVYSIIVMRPTQSEASMSDFKTVTEVRFRVSGEPVIASSGNSPAAYAEGSSSVNSQVEVHRLQYEERERERLHAERIRAQEKAERIQLEAIPNIYETTKRVVEDNQRLSSAQVEFWKEEADRLRSEALTVRNEAQRELNARDADVRKLHEEIMALKERATTNQLNLETKVISELRAQHDARVSELKDQTSIQVRELRDRFDEERRRMQEEHSKKLADLSEEHRKTLDALTRRHDEERRNYESSQALERERLREDSRYRIDQTASAKEAEIRQLRETYDQRIADLRLATDRELQSLRDATQREIESIRQSERAQSTLARESAEMRKEALRAEELRLRQELTDLRRETTELRDRLDHERAKQHKDLPTAIREAREMAGHLGLVDASELERPEPEQSTTSQLLGLARQAFDAAPQVLDKIMQARREQTDAVMQAQRVQQVQAMQVQQAQAQAQAAQRAPRQLAAPQQPAQAQRQLPGRYAPPAAAQRAQAPRAAAPFGAAYVPQASSPVPFQPPASVAASPLQPSVPAPAPDMAAQQLEPPIDGGAIPADAQESTPPPTAGDTGALIVKFFEKLDGAIRNKVLSPETFAIGVIDEIGPEQTALLLQQFSPAEIVETAQQISADSVIPTRDGQKFVNELWRSATRKVEERGIAMP